MSMRTEKSASTILSILKIKNKSTSHRVRFELPEDLREIFIDFKSRANEGRYKDLVCTIRDSVVDDDTLIKLLQNAESCISLLDYDLRLFVQALVILGWNYRSERVVLRYEEFIRALVSAHIHYTDFVIEQLVKLFATADGEDLMDELPSSAHVPHFENVHIILRSLLETVPLTDEIIVKKLRSNFPHFLVSCSKHLAYMHNCMRVIEYLPQHRRDILLLLVDKLITLDVHTSKDELDMMGDNAPLVDALDCGMLRLFQYIDSVCRPDGGEPCPVKTNALFNDLMQVLEECILRTYASFHVQFLLFYTCSIQQSISNSFLKILWHKVENPAEPTVIRKTAVSYIASFLARAAFIPNGFLKLYLHQMTTWVHRYIVNHEDHGNKTSQGDVHAVFYYVCQAVFYLIAFRQSDLFDSAKKLAFLQSLNLAKIVHCSLNPLGACDTVVVDNFAAVAKDYQLAYCYTVIERNDRIFLERATIDAFFPYDPYLLKRSSSYIAPLYRENQLETSEHEDTNVPTAEATMDCSNLEDDDFIADRSIPIPIRKREPDYSTSPGFKMSM